MLGEGLSARNHNVTIFAPYLLPTNGVQHIFVDIKTNAYEEYAQKAAVRNRRQCAFLDFINLALLSRQMCFGMSAVHLNFKHLK